MTSLGSALEAFIPRARRLRRAGPGSRAIAAPLGEFYDVTQFAAISGYRVRRDYTAGTGIRQGSDGRPG